MLSKAASSTIFWVFGMNPSLPDHGQTLYWLSQWPSSIPKANSDKIHFIYWKTYKGICVCVYIYIYIYILHTYIYTHKFSEMEYPVLVNTFHISCLNLFKFGQLTLNSISIRSGISSLRISIHLMIYIWDNFMNILSVKVKV